MKKTLAAIIAAAFAITILSCSGGDGAATLPATTGAPERTDTEVAATQTQESQAEANETREQEPTETQLPATPGPTATPTPTAAPTPFPTPTPSPTPGPTAEQLAAYRCFEDFFGWMTSYETENHPAGHEITDPMNETSTQMRISNEDCSSWSPDFADDRGNARTGHTCTGWYIGGERLTSWGLDPRGELMENTTFFGVVGAEWRGYLIHIRKLPYSEGSGCWYINQRGSEIELLFDVLTPDGKEVEQRVFIVKNGEWIHPNKEETQTLDYALGLATP